MVTLYIKMIRSIYINWHFLHGGLTCTDDVIYTYIANIFISTYRVKLHPFQLQFPTVQGNALYTLEINHMTFHDNEVYLH